MKASGPMITSAPPRVLARGEVGAVCAATRPPRRCGEMPAKGGCCAMHVASGSRSTACSVPYVRYGDMDCMHVLSDDGCTCSMYHASKSGTRRSAFGATQR